jgi:hypothetical protein
MSNDGASYRMRFGCAVHDVEQKDNTADGERANGLAIS